MRRPAAIIAFASIALLTPLPLYSQGYSGPSLLSRGGNQPGQRGRAPIDFNIYGAVRGTRDTGLIAPSVDETGNIVPVDSYGVQAEIGAYGAKEWRRSSIGLDYRGDYRKYTQASRFDGSNQALSLDLTYQLARRFTYFNRLTAGTSNRAFGAFAAPTFADQQNFGVPLNEVYDSRANYVQLNAGISYQPSARSLYTAMGEGFVTKRRSEALISVQGYRALGAYEYRLTRSDTVGVAYNFMRFEYPVVYGRSDIHSLVATYRRRLNRDWELNLNAGLFRSETLGSQTVQLSPEIAAILGRTTGVEAFQRTDIAPQFLMNVNYTLERSRMTVALQSGITPGNGVYVTSRQEGLQFGYSYSGIRRLALGLSAGYVRYTSLALDVGNYSNLQGGGGLNYELKEHLNLSVQIDRRQFSSPVVVGRSGTSTTVGLSYSPARFPLSIW